MNCHMCREFESRFGCSLEDLSEGRDPDNAPVRKLVEEVAASVGFAEPIEVIGNPLINQLNMSGGRDSGKPIITYGLGITKVSGRYQTAGIIAHELAHIINNDGLTDSVSPAEQRAWERRADLYAAQQGYGRPLMNHFEYLAAQPFRKLSRMVKNITGTPVSLDRYGFDYTALQQLGLQRPGRSVDDETHPSDEERIEMLQNFLRDNPGLPDRARKVDW